MADGTQRKPFAMHGFFVLVPADWDCVINKGDWQGGYAVLAEDREPRLNLTWQRSKRSPDFERSLARMGRQMRQDHAAELVRTEQLDGGGLLARFTASDGQRHVAFLRPDPDLAFTLVLRQVLPGSSDALRTIASTARTLALGDPMPWRFYGLAIDLPPYWQLVGVHNLVGLLRAVWFRRPDPGKRATGVLVLRRYALGQRLLAGRGIGGWVGDHLGPKERLLDENLGEDGTWSAVSQAPGDNLWRRLRGIREERRLHAWYEEERDRLILQEFKGSEPFVPALRYPQRLNTVASFDAREAQSTS